VGGRAVIEHVIGAMKLAGKSDIAVVRCPKKHGLSDYRSSGKWFGVTPGVAEMEDVSQHGIIAPVGYRIADMVEKPSPDKAFSRVGSVGMYVFSPGLFDVLRKTKPGYRGEIQLTDFE
jgi:dTDP-glucose pyrophosphorylase